ncbi:YobH family protein [Mangrovicoccus ximenensis]|uniref:hypothetical protein n=1 Tax=Mangrovicoccus ximenensis TaxID=1911570 RepID=UPI000D3CE285|nr:hypothetical protein [Mangrovicoccus ximenensis]
MRLVLRGLILVLAASWGWLAWSGNGVLVWQQRAEDQLICSYATALDLVEVSYFRQPDGPLGRDRCPLRLPLAGVGLSGS